LVRAVLTPLVGSLSDRIGRKPIVQTVNIAFFVLAYPMFLWLKTDPGFTSMLVVSSVAGVMMAMVGGAGPVMLCELFPTSLRSTSIGIGYNISAAIYGGFAPFICTFLVRQTGDAISPTYFLLACAAVSIAVVATIKDRTNVPLEEL
jgi:MHS family proline/betaine transporter-like MFS transporter